MRQGCSVTLIIKKRPFAHSAVSEVQVRTLIRVSEFMSVNVARVQRHAAKKNAGHKALLVLDKQIKINMCRTKERRQQNEC
jgi:hypothetical protein